MKAQKLVTRESLTTLIREAAAEKQMRIVGRALLVLLNNQTASEQVNLITTDLNGVGFTGADAEFGTICAKFYKERQFLTPKQVAPWIRLSKSGSPRISKYHNQLNKAAMRKAVDPT